MPKTAFAILIGHLGKEIVLTVNILDSLNPQQAEAVKEIDKPLLIIAGAGSGKTLTLASKIAYLIEHDAKPENILALAFNQKAAEELKDRVLGMVGNAEDLSISNVSFFL